MSDAEQGAFADWLIALDDGLCYRHRHCTLCGRLADGYYDAAILSGGRVVAYRVCSECRRHDPKREKLGALLQQRYGPQ